MQVEETDKILEDSHSKIEWVSDCCLAPSEQFSATDTSWQEQVTIQWDDDVWFVLDQHALLDFCTASSLKQHSVSWHDTPLRHIILIPSQPAFALTH